MESTLDVLAERFRRFAELECGSYEPLYFELANAIAGDRELLQIASQSKAGQPISNLLFAAVQFLLLQGAGEELRAYYAGLSPQPLPPQEAFGAFKAFVLEHQESIIELLRTRLVQTNEVGRCGPLVPCFTAVQSMGGGRPLALIDMGTSSGLNLNFDRYYIHYDDRTTWGEIASGVHLSCPIESEASPPVISGKPEVAWRVGVDLKAFDLSDETEALWLRALVWPSIPDRAEALARAIDIWHQHRPDVREGDALDLLPGLIAEAAADTTLCLFHCHVLNQFPAEAKERLETLLLEASVSRPIFRLALEGIQIDGAVRSGLEVFRYADGMRTGTVLGHAHPHGRGLYWSASASA